jgi:hypothetical protein
VKLLFKLFLTLIAAPIVAAMAITWLFLRPTRLPNDIGDN